MLHLVAHHLYEPRHQASRAVGGRRGLSTSEGGCGIALTSLKLVAVRGTVGITLRDVSVGEADVSSALGVAVACPGSVRWAVVCGVDQNLRERRRARQ
jgi:hypothetical protein